jgi:uncharacterized repeat protein (TIGR03803 family)
MSGRISLVAAPLAGLVLMAMSATATPAHSAGFKVVYAFQGGSDGAQPAISVRDRAGNLYGVTGDGGGNGCGGSGCGGVFKLSSSGTMSVLYNFAGGADGYYPGSVVMDKHGDLYGTTYYGGNKGCDGNGCGTVFKLATDGTKTVLHVFKNGSDGALSEGGLVNVGGSYYGTTTQGGIKNCGPYNCGTVFKVDAEGNETIMHRFAGGNDGAYPGGGLIADSAGNLYGTTALGGSSSDCEGSGCGTVFKVAPDGSETVLYAFHGGSDGSGPTSTLLRDSSGNLYGTTAVGGSSNCQGFGCGTVFRIGADGTERVLYAFTGFSDGNWPWGNLTLDAKGNLFGMTDVGGEGSGVIFKLTQKGKGSVLHTFTGGKDGSQPNGFIADKTGELFGATLYGGKAGEGVVFRLEE